MKIIKIITSLVFSALILIPAVLFNWDTDAISEIDNRKLYGNPFSAEGDLTENIENSVNDRIGLRNEMITAYTVLNDSVFGKMVHPSYTYGEDGYVFGSGITTNNDKYGEYHEAFALAVKEMQTYCEERSIPFVFVFNPAKPAVLEQYVSKGINYDRSWVDAFLKQLDELGVNYVDNTVTLKEKTAAGETVFNQKYDANHWNDLGAFYGCNAILENLKQAVPSVHINDLSEFDITEQVQTSLPVSQFPINEAVPVVTSKDTDLKNLTNAYYNELELNPSYKTVGYYQNNKRAQDGAPSALVFQGSYMNGFGTKYLANSFSEYAYIHDYQNVLDMPYYVNIFNPDCVVFEVAEYTFSDGYFSFEKMKNLDFQTSYDSAVTSVITATETKTEKADITAASGEVLTVVRWNCSTEFDNVWLSLADRKVDMKKVDGGYTVTVKNADYEKVKNQLEVSVIGDGTLTLFKK